MKARKLKSQCELIDTVLLGGIPRGQIVGIHGNYNVGKTILNFQYAFSYLEQEPKMKAIIINTEPQSLQLENLSFFKDRFNYDEERMEIINASSLVDLFNFLGYDFSYVFSSEGKISIALKNKYTFKQQEKRRGVLFSEVGFFSVDSISTPLKQLMLNETKNLAARSSLIYFLFGQLQSLTNKYDLFCTLVNHTSYNPVIPYDIGKISGGAAIQYNLKFIFRVLNGLSEMRKKYGDEAKRIRVDRMPFVKLDNVNYNVLLKTNYGFCDCPPEEKTKGETKEMTEEAEIEATEQIEETAEKSGNVELEEAEQNRGD